MDRNYSIQYIVVQSFKYLTKFIFHVPWNIFLYFMKTRFLQFLVLFSLLLTTFILQSSLADESSEFYFTELSLGNSQKQLLLFGTIENGLRSEMTESLQNGIELDFIFFVELHKATPNWPKELIKSFSFKHTISYDTLRDTYQVLKEENNSKVTRSTSLIDAQQTSEQINDAVVVPLSQLIPEQHYEIRIRAELTQQTMDFGADRMLPLIKKKDIKTKWHIIQFIY